MQHKYVPRAWTVPFLSLEIRHLHTCAVDCVYSLAFSPDGEYLAVGTMRKVHLYHVQSGQVVRTLGEEYGAAQQVVFCDGDIVVGWDCGTVWKYRGESAHKTRLFTDGVKKMVIAPNGKIAAVDYYTSVVFQDTDSSVRLGKIVGRDAVGEMRFSPDSGKLVVSWLNGEVGAYTVPDGKELWLRKTRPLCMSVSPDGQYLALGLDKKVEIAEMESGKQVAESDETFELVLSVAFSPNSLVAYTDVSGLLILRTQTFEPHPGALVLERRAGKHIAFSPQGNYLATGGTDGVVHWYQYAKLEPAHSFQRGRENEGKAAGAD